VLDGSLTFRSMLTSFHTTHLGLGALAMAERISPNRTGAADAGILNLNSVQANRSLEEERGKRMNSPDWTQIERELPELSIVSARFIGEGWNALPTS
jgi:hypothetical protein